MSARQDGDLGGDYGRLSAKAIFAGLDEDRSKDGHILRHSPEMTGPGEVPPARRNEPWLIGVVSTTPDLPQSLHPFFGPVLAGVKTDVYAAHCDILIPAHAPLSSDGADPYAIARCHSHGVHGLIVMGIGGGDADYELVVESGLPAVFVDFDVIGERIGYVMSNNFDGMASALAHLHKLGCRRIATITGQMKTRPGIDRLLGYRSGLARLGLEEREEYVVEGDFYHHSGYEQMQRLLALPEPPDAVAAASDMSAIGAVLAIEEAGLRVPEDIAVTGFDDAPFAQLLRPALTTVRQDAFGLGRAAAEGILKMLDEPDSPPPAVLLPTELVVRESCGIEVPRSAADDKRAADSVRSDSRAADT